jgi:hypothetical protein
VDKLKDALGIAGSGKYLYQAGRAFAGMQTTTPVTVGLDLASGAVGLSSAKDLTSLAKALSTETKGLVGAARLSNAGKIANYASKAAPIVSKGTALLGVALGGVEMARGAKALKAGKKTEGTDRLVAGACDVVTSSALYVAAASGATVLGLPVAGVALAVAGISQGGKYAHKFRAPLGKAARNIGGKLAEGAGLARKGARSTAARLKEGARVLRAETRQAGARIGNKVGEQMDQVKAGAKACCKVLSEGLNRIKNLFN